MDYLYSMSYLSRVFVMKMWILFVLLLTVLIDFILAIESTVCLNRETGPTKCSENNHTINCEPYTIRLLEMNININDQQRSEGGTCCDVNETDCHRPFMKDMMYVVYRLCSGNNACTTKANFEAKANQQDHQACQVGHAPNQDFYETSSTISYECVNASDFINICPSGTEITGFQGNTSILHLFYKHLEPARVTEVAISCTCAIKATNPQDHGLKFEMKTQDVRLKRANYTACSSAQLTLSGNPRVYTTQCVESGDIYANFVNQEQVSGSVSDTLTVTLDNITRSVDEPDMVWITVQVAVQGTITCTSQLMKHDSSGGGKQPLSGNGSHTVQREEDLVKVIVPVVCGVIFLVILSVVAVILYRRRKNIICFKGKSEGTKQHQEYNTSGDVYSTIPADFSDCPNDINVQGIETNPRQDYPANTTNPAYSYSTVIKENASEYQKINSKNEYDKINKEGWKRKNEAENTNDIHTYGQTSDITGDYNTLNFVSNIQSSLAEEDYSRCSLNDCDEYSHLDGKMQQTENVLPESEYNHLSKIQIENQSDQENTQSTIQREIISDKDNIKHITEEPVQNDIPPTLKRVDSYETPVLKTSSVENKGFPAQDVNSRSAAAPSEEPSPSICLPVRNAVDSSEEEDTSESDSSDIENGSESISNEMNTQRNPADYKNNGQTDPEIIEQLKTPKRVDSYEKPVLFSDKL